MHDALMGWQRRIRHVKIYKFVTKCVAFKPLNSPIPPTRKSHPDLVRWGSGVDWEGRLPTAYGVTFRKDSVI